MAPKRILGIDYGRARIGIAVSDPTGQIASPVACLSLDSSLEKSLQALSTRLSSFGTFSTIVLGYPLLLSGKEGEMAKEAKAFGEVLSKHLECPLTLWDERLTSLQIERMLKEAEMSRKKRSAVVDSLAATLILQNYLDFQLYRS